MTQNVEVKVLVRPEFLTVEGRVTFLFNEEFVQFEIFVIFEVGQEIQYRVDTLLSKLFLENQ